MGFSSDPKVMLVEVAFVAVLFITLFGKGLGGGGKK